MFDAKDVKERIVGWIREWFGGNASPETKAVIGVSGGKDSSIVCALCVEALGADRVFGVLMPNGVQGDIDVARALCTALDIDYVEINIEDAVQGLYGGIHRAGLEVNDPAAFNTPARVRMMTLYAVSAIVGGRVANTCNLSEDWVGYSTKFGDSAGDFSPMSDLTVGEVKAVGRELGLASEFIDKVPEDGLCGKTDEDSLGFSYEVLDRYIREGICEDAEVRARIDRLHEAGRHKLEPMPAFRLGEQDKLNAWLDHLEDPRI